MWLGRVRNGLLLHRKNAVAGLDQWYPVAGQGKAHHGSAHNQVIADSIPVTAGEFHQMTDRGAESNFPVTRIFYIVSGQGDDPGYQSLVIFKRRGDGGTGANILAKQADIESKFSVRDFLAGQNLNQLLFPSGRIYRWYDHDFGIRQSVLRQRDSERLQGFGFVALDADECISGVECRLKITNTANNFLCLVLHQDIVAGDIGVTLHPVDYQAGDALCTSTREFG